MADRLGEVVGIRRPRVANIRREHNRMACPVQLGDHTPVGEIIVQVEPHAPDTPSAGTQGGVSSPICIKLSRLIFPYRFLLGAIL